MFDANAAAERPYFDDPYRLEFDARVAGRRTDERGEWVRLDLSFFYPESGGQEADRGWLGDTPVLDVQSDDAGLVWHLLGGPVADRVAARIDGERRHSNRRQHTGQHILSQAFIRVLDADTTSSRLGLDIGSIDLDRPQLAWEEVERVERAANEIVWENRAVTSRFTDAEELRRLAPRRPPAVSGRVRIVEVADWDVSACGGTHCRSAGEVGAIKVRRWEKSKGGVRVEFVCGDRALRDHQRRVRSLVEAGLRRNTGDGEVLDTLERAAQERDDLRKQVRVWMERAARAEAAAAAAAHAASGDRVLVEIAPQASVDELRLWARSLAAAGVPRVVLATRAPQPFVLVTKPKESAEVDLRTLLPVLLAAAGGKGGGSPDEIQAGATDADAAERAARAVAEAWGN
jgi:alanyl-tRNA synthetase